jgi:hypothetical protein
VFVDESESFVARLPEFLSGEGERFARAPRILSNYHWTAARATADRGHGGIVERCMRLAAITPAAYVFGDAGAAQGGV